MIMIYNCYNYYILMLFFMTKLHCYRIRELVTKSPIKQTKSVISMPYRPDFQGFCHLHAFQKMHVPFLSNVFFLITCKIMLLVPNIIDLSDYLSPLYPCFFFILIIFLKKINLKPLLSSQDVASQTACIFLPLQLLRTGSYF